MISINAKRGGVKTVEDRRKCATKELKASNKRAE